MSSTAAVAGGSRGLIRAGAALCALALVGMFAAVVLAVCTPDRPSASTRLARPATSPSGPLQPDSSHPTARTAR